MKGIGALRKKIKFFFDSALEQNCKNQIPEQHYFDSINYSPYPGLYREPQKEVDTFSWIQAESAVFCIVGGRTRSVIIPQG